ncbi:MAG: undecaprenyl-diphosphate phosphatase [Armatimonadota bacterium]|nr:undecaprenyl-diphosphate phosphatase [Armatimonadota bacterium]
MMLRLAFLGIIQGLTEFLPVSSSAHLVFAEAILGIPRPGVFLEAILHLGTLVALVVAFREDLVAIARGFLLSLLRPREWVNGNPHRRGIPWEGRLAWLILVGSVPTGLMGLLFEQVFEQIFASITLVAMFLLVTGAILLVSERRSASRPLQEARVLDALTIGVAQGLAIAPGISRSGITIAAGLWRGMDREASARFSFLLAIPAILGASLYKAKEMALAQAMGITPFQLLVAFGTSVVTGYLAIRWMLEIVRRARLFWFAYYCLGLGLFVLIFSLLR